MVDDPTELDTDDEEDIILPLPAIAPKVAVPAKVWLTGPFPLPVHSHLSSTCSCPTS
jgi:hypothetical protein